MAGKKNSEQKKERHRPPGTKKKNEAGAGPRSKPPNDPPTKEILPVELTPAEIPLHAKESARLHGDLIKLDQQRKDAAASFRAQMAAIETRIGELNRKIESGHEDREVACYWRFDYSAGTKTLFRRADRRRPDDEDEEIKSYALLPDERQQRLPLIDHHDHATPATSPSSAPTIVIDADMEDQKIEKNTEKKKEEKINVDDGKHDAPPATQPQ